eukprot:3940419-Rhodomonas_salina.3
MSYALAMPCPVLIRVSSYATTGTENAMLLPGMGSSGRIGGVDGANVPCELFAMLSAYAY